LSSHPRRTKAPSPCPLAVLSVLRRRKKEPYDGLRPKTSMVRSIEKNITKKEDGKCIWK